MSIGDIEKSFRAGAEAQGRDQIGGTSISTPPSMPPTPPPAVTPVVTPPPVTTSQAAIAHHQASQASTPPPTASPVTQTADDWLQDFYNEAGLGTVDAGGRSYWEGDLAGGQTKEQIRANIMRHA